MKRASKAAVIAMTVAITACGNKDSAEETAATETGSTNTSLSTVLSANKLSVAFPSSLAIQAFPQTTSASLWGGENSFYLADADAESDTTDKSYEKQRAASDKILKGEGDTCVDPILKTEFKEPDEEKCYEFDSEMIQFKKADALGEKTHGTSTGKNSKGEACLVAFARSKVAMVKDILGRSQGMVRTVLCQANKEAKAAGKDDIRPAAVGDAVDLLEYAKNAFPSGDKAPTFTTAKMTRMADSSDGKPVYQTVIVASDPFGIARKIVLTHAPNSDSDNDVNSGTLYMTHKSGGPKGGTSTGAGGGKVEGGKASGTGGAGAGGSTKTAGGAGGSQTTKTAGGAKLADTSSSLTNHLSIGYARTKDSDGNYSTSYEARFAIFSDDINPLTALGVIDFNANADFTGTAGSANYGRFKKSDGTYYTADNLAASGFMMISSVQNEATGEQQFSYWQNPGSNYIENARGMVFSVKKDTDGNLAGCATSGATRPGHEDGLSIRRSFKEQTADSSLIPRGFFHPFTNTDTKAVGGCAPVVKTDGSDYKYSSTSACAGKSSKYEWRPLTTTGDDSVTYVTKASGPLFSRQCFKQGTDGLWAIDTNQTTSADGFDIIKSTDTAKLITPPDVSKAKPEEGKAPPVDPEVVAE